MEKTMRKREPGSPTCGETEEPLDDVQGLSAYLGTATFWIYARTRYSSENKFPALRVGRHLRFRRSEVLRWLKDNSAAK